MTALDYWVDVIVLILLMGWSLTNMQILITEVNTPMVAGIEDKTALKVSGGIEAPNDIKTGADLIATLMVVDSNTPYPKAIKINNSPVMKLDNTFVVNKQDKLSIMFSPNGDYKLGEMLDYKVKDAIFVDDANGDYWHYILEE